MPNAIDLATLLAQTPHVAKVKTAAVAQGEANKSELVRQAQTQHLRDRASVGKTQEAQAVRRKEESQDDRRQSGHGMHQNKTPEEEQTDDGSCSSDHGSVCGQIINRRI